MNRLRFLTIVMTTLVVAVCTASGAMADTVTWGVSGVTPTMDTANGDYQDSTTTTNNTSVCPYGIICSPQVNPLSGTNPILPAPYSGENTADVWHYASDLGVWNTGSSLVAPANGQVLAVKVTGCAVEDTRSPIQESQTIPVNRILFQDLTPAGSDWNNLYVSNAFQLPFCGGATTAKTVTTFQPIHMCINAGDALSLHDTGGFVQDNGRGYYPQGIPLLVLAPQAGQATASFVGTANQYGPGSYQNGLGYATESDQEVTMQVIEGTANDAYGLCTGGFADEPSASSNAIDCDYHANAVNTKDHNPVKYPDHPFCAGPGQPIKGSNIPPSGSSKKGSGTTTHTAPARPPLITRLKFNPPRFVAKRGSTVTYRDSEPGVTTLRFYRVEGGKDVLVKTIHHQDQVATGIHVGGLTPGNYVVSLTSVYRHATSRAATTRITVIARR